MRNRYKIVYPGHPVTLALLVIRKYDSLESALALGHEFSRALEDDDIPGSGAAIHMSLELLKKIARGEDPDKAVAEAERLWAVGGAGGIPTAVRPGQEQADAVRAEFLRAVVEWVAREPRTVGPTSRTSF